MRNTFLTFLFVAFSSTLFGQTNSGKLVYKSNYEDAGDTLVDANDPMRFTTIYFLGDLKRTETKSKLGNQILIENLKTNTAHLLLHLGQQKLAIFVDYNKDTSAAKNPYSLKNRCGKKEIAGFKTKRSIIKRYGKEFDLFYLKSTDAKYSPAYNDAKGLPLQYKLYSDDVAQNFICTELKFYAVEPDVFEIPDGYIKLTMEQFLEGITSE